MKKDVLQQALDAHIALREWINAIPQETVLPAMPGVDGDWLDEVEASLRADLAQPEQKPAAQPNAEQEPVRWWEYQTIHPRNAELDNGIRVTGNFDEAKKNGIPDTIKPLTYEQHSHMWDEIRELCYTTKDQTSEIMEIVTAVLDHCYGASAVTDDMIQRATKAAHGIKAE